MSTRSQNSASTASPDASIECVRRSRSLSRCRLRPETMLPAASSTSRLYSRPPTAVSGLRNASRWCWHTTSIASQNDTLIGDRSSERYI